MEEIKKDSVDFNCIRKHILEKKEEIKKDILESIDVLVDEIASYENYDTFDEKTIYDNLDGDFISDLVFDIKELVKLSLIGK